MITELDDMEELQDEGDEGGSVKLCLTGGGGGGGWDGGQLFKVSSNTVREHKPDARVLFWGFLLGPD